MEPTRPTSAGPPLRWTYAGDLDDMVTQYPWARIAPASKRALDVRLAFCAVTGSRILLNDGYLILNPACFESLKDPNSPLRVLINQGYVRVLSRNPSHSLKQVVVDGAKQGIKTYQEFQASWRWSDRQRVLDRVEPDLTDKFWDWPDVDLSKSYMKLASCLATIPKDHRGIAVDDQVFQDVVKRLQDELGHNPNKPRSCWQGIVKKLGQAKFQELMELGNEIYHHNFGVALAGCPPADLSTAEVAVQTRLLPVFMELLYKTYAPQVADQATIPPQLTLPGGVDYSKSIWLGSLFLSEQPLGKARDRYLEVRARYLAGNAPFQEMKEATEYYQAKLHEHLEQAPHKKFAGHAGNLAVSAVPVTLAVAGIATASVPTVCIAIVAFGATEFGVPVVTEKWRVPFKEDNFNPQMSARWSKAFKTRAALTALAVDQGRAVELIKDLPKFSGTGPS